MVMNSLKAATLIAGGTVIAAVAYISGAVDFLFPEQNPQVATLPQPESASQGQTVTRPDGDRPQVEGMAVPSPDEAAGDGASGEPAIVVPTFDIVRVEPDGSLVIAGNAAAHAKVEVVTGSTVIGSDAATDEGDFAVVLDEPLKPGDYTIVLRATSPDNVVVTSEETAVVSVPDGAAGQVLALVEKPGAPSKLITVPEPAAPQPTEAGQSPAAADQSSQMAASSSEEEEPAKAAAGAAVTTQNQMAAQPAGQMMAAAPAPAAEEQAQPTMAAQVPEANQQAAAPSAAQPVDQAMAASEAAPEATAKPVTEAANAGENARVETQLASTEPQAPAVAAEKPHISVEAVEIEGDHVFVAGRADAGARVRVYANEILLGDAESSPGGQWLVEAVRDLPVGDYIVRADLLGPRAEVLARAAVPFEREPGETLAAVAQGEPALQSGQSAANAPVAAADASASQAAQPVAGSDEANGQALAADTKQQAAASQAASAGPKPAGEGTQAASQAAGSEASRPAGQAAAAQPKPQPSSGESAPANASGPDGSRMAATDAPGTDAAAVSQPAASGGQVASAQPQQSVVDGQEVTAPKLKNVAGAVIIRRGDTLWRISRRVYGRGIRYTTIYLANQDQIEDPDRIWPGQVFSVPGKSSAGEEADLSAIADRVVKTE